MQNWIKKLSLFQTSIKTLTLMGFGLVALPLVFALLYSANQVNQLSKQGTTAIFNVAELVESNRKVSQILTRFERFASQYVVLQEQELLSLYTAQKKQLKDVLAQEFSHYDDEQFSTIIQQYLTQIDEVAPDSVSLEQLQSQFKTLARSNQQLSQYSNQVISQQANNMELSANHVKKTMLFSLLIIPITLLIAGFFIVLITQPLKVLLSKINLLEQGDFQRSIAVEGSVEIEEIADALELMRSRLHALELQKSSFIRHISHELKTPLAAIREGTELLYDNSVGNLNRDQQEITNIIRTSVTRLQKLIEDLLDFNIVLDSTSLQDGEVIILKKEIESALALRVLDLKRKQLKVTQEVAHISLQCNQKQLSVIFDNLLSNAIKFSPDKSTILIKAWSEQQTLYLTVTDQGEGIKSTLYNTIFDAFYQGTTAHNSLVKGSGLGLTIVKELLMRLNGTISIESSTTSPSYTTFKMQLPKARLISSTDSPLQEKT